MTDGVHASVGAIQKMEEACARFSRVILERLPDIESELRHVTEALEEHSDELRGEISRLGKEISSADEDDNTSRESNRLAEAEEELASVHRRRRKLAEASAAYAVQTRKTEHLATSHTVRAREFLRGAANDLKGYLTLNPEQTSVPLGEAGLISTLAISETFDGNALAMAKIESLFAQIGIRSDAQISIDQVCQLFSQLRYSKPARATEKVVVACADDGACSNIELMEIAQDCFSFLDPDVVKSLPPFRIQLADLGDNMKGVYIKAEELILVSKRFVQLGIDALRSTVYHEIMHWYHLNGPQQFRTAITAHYLERTKGETRTQLSGYLGVLGKKDMWYDSYAGLEKENDEMAGREVPTRYFQLLSSRPRMLLEHWNRNPAAFSETFKIVLTGLRK